MMLSASLHMYLKSSLLIAQDCEQQFNLPTRRCYMTLQNKLFPVCFIDLTYIFLKLVSLYL